MTTIRLDGRRQPLICIGVGLPESLLFRRGLFIQPTAVPWTAGWVGVRGSNRCFSAAKSDSPADHRNAAPRIIDTRKIGLKTQKKLVELRKEVAKGPKIHTSTSFRKKTLDKEERLARENAAEEALREELKKQKARNSQALRNLYFTKKEMAQPPVLLVDGYNVLYRWLELPGDDERKERARHNWEDARDMLINDCAEYSQHRGVKVVLAFDAMGLNGSGTHRDIVAGVEVVYCGDQEADSFLVREGHALREGGTPEVLVATSDMEICDSVSEWGNRLHYCSSEQLLSEMKRAGREMDDDLKKRRAKAAALRPVLGPAVLQAQPELHTQLLQLKQALQRGNRRR